MTLRKYYQDPYCKEWTASVAGKLARGGRIGVILDETCFYPGGGGQPADAGWIGADPVLEITEEDGELVHWVATEPPEDRVECRLDWDRRWDYMQQHTGQHILSAAFEKELNAATVSFHLGEEQVTIDLSATDLGDAELQRAEETANQVVTDNLSVEIRLFEPGQAIPLPLRKAPVVSGYVRIVAVEGVDYSPCGGTHCLRTGEIGLIKIVRAERRRQQTRIYFLCGGRALHDYQRKHAIVAALANRFTVADSEVLESVTRLEEETKGLRREVKRLQEQMLEFETSRLLAGADTVGKVRVVHSVFDDRSADEVKRLAVHLAEQGQTVALLASRGGQVQVTFARSADVGYDMATLLRKVAPKFGGRGGGQPHLAQGGGTEPGAIEEALQHAVSLLREG
jgi:alanyl-tRNA synthetase